MPGLQRIIRLRELPEFVGLRRTQIRHLIAQRDFPQPIRLGARAKGWLASEVEQWQRHRVAARDARSAAEGGGND